MDSDLTFRLLVWFGFSVCFTVSPVFVVACFDFFQKKKAHEEDPNTVKMPIFRDSIIKSCSRGELFILAFSMSSTAMGTMVSGIDHYSSHEIALASLLVILLALTTASSIAFVVGSLDGVPRSYQTAFVKTSAWVLASSVVITLIIICLDFGWGKPSV